MKLTLVFFLFAALQAFASHTPVKYEINGKVFTSHAVHFKGGYGYNLNAQQVLKLVTLDWPPYIDEELCNKGWLYQFTISSLLSSGYGVKISFLPWARAVREAEFGRADILFPEYFIEDDVISDNFVDKTHNDLLAFSDPVPGGDLALVTLEDNDISYNGKLISIKNQTIGIVRSHKYTQELDAMINNKEINIIAANNEYQLIHLLLNNRVALIVADLKVLKANIYKFPLPIVDKHQILASLVALEPKLGYKPLYYSVNKSIPNWQKVLNDLNDKIDEMKKNTKFELFIDQMNKQCIS